MALGGARPGAGRKKGSLGKTKKDILAVFREANPDFNPLIALKECADKAETNAERARILGDLIGYIIPKLKAVEHSNPDGSALQTTITINVIGPPQAPSK